MVYNICYRYKRDEIEQNLPRRFHDRRTSRHFIDILSVTSMYSSDILTEQNMLFKSYS